MKAIAFYYSPSCAFSAGALAFLASRGADFQVINVDEHDELRATLQKRLGAKKFETPTLEVEGQLFVAPPLSELKVMLEEWGLPLSAAPHQQLQDLTH